MRFSFDSNGTPVPVRNGDPIGGVFAPGSFAVDTWHRLMPHGDATKVDDQPKELFIGTLRADLTSVATLLQATTYGANLSNWQFYILNKGYEANFRIAKYDHDSEAVTLDTTHYERVSDYIANLPDTVEYVIRPHMILPFTLHNRSGSTNDVTLGYSDAASEDHVIELSLLSPGESFVLPVSNIHDLFFKYAAVGASDKLEWGEHYKA